MRKGTVSTYLEKGVNVSTCAGGAKVVGVQRNVPAEGRG